MNLRTVGIVTNTNFDENANQREESMIQSEFNNSSLNQRLRNIFRSCWFKRSGK